MGQNRVAFWTLLRVMLRVSVGKGAGSGLETQVITWARSPRQAWNRDFLGENGPEASVRGRRRGRQKGLEASQASLSLGRKRVTKD